MGFTKQTPHDENFGAGESNQHTPAPSKQTPKTLLFAPVQLGASKAARRNKDGSRTCMCIPLVTLLLCPQLPRSGADRRKTWNSRAWVQYTQTLGNDRLLHQVCCPFACCALPSLFVSQCYLVLGQLPRQGPVGWCCKPKPSERDESEVRGAR